MTNNSRSKWRKSYLPCSVEDCSRNHYAKGYCRMHWRRVKSFGVPDALPKTLEERFWAKVSQGDGCWLWQGSCGSPDAYGHITEGRKLLLAHRVSWVIHHGAIPDGLCVCHRCDNPRCVRPDHFFLGSHFENHQDAVRKGRLKCAACEVA